MHGRCCFTPAPVATHVFACDRLSRGAQLVTLTSDVALRPADEAAAVMFAKRLELGLKSVHSFDKVSCCSWKPPPPPARVCVCGREGGREDVEWGSD